VTLSNPALSVPWCPLVSSMSEERLQWLCGSSVSCMVKMLAFVRLWNDRTLECVITYILFM
jgi:hypothetical protein